MKTNIITLILSFALLLAACEKHEPQANAGKGKHFAANQ
jgi:hypothetical protein